MRMRKLIILIILCVAPRIFSLDILETRKGMKYSGKIVKVQDTKEGRAFVMKTTQGSTVALLQKHIARIRRGNEIIDLLTGERYYQEIRRPYLPFAVLGIASGVYAVNRFQEYNRLHDKAEQESELAGVDPETINTNDQKNAMAAGIVSSIISVGSFIVAIRPMEIRVPIGKVKVSGVSNGIQVALHF